MKMERTTQCVEAHHVKHTWHADRREWKNIKWRL